MDRGKLVSFVFKITLLNVKLCLEGLDENEEIETVLLSCKSGWHKVIRSFPMLQVKSSVSLILMSKVLSGSNLQLVL